MKNKENREKPIGNVLDAMFKKYRLQPKMREIDIVNRWEEIVGSLVFKHTSEIKMLNKTLYVKFDNAPLKNEMFLQKDLLLKRVNDAFEEQIIEKIFIG